MKPSLTSIEMKFLDPFVNLRVFITKEVRMNERFLFRVHSKSFRHRHLIFLEIDDDFLLRLESFLFERFGFDTIDDLALVLFFV